MDKDRFFSLSTDSMKEELLSLNGPKCVAIMIDGSRRIGKLERPIDWEENSLKMQGTYYDTMMWKVLDGIDYLWSIGIDVIIGPIASYNNILRNNFIPNGLYQLLKPLASEKAFEIFRRHNVFLSFYGDLGLVDSQDETRLISNLIIEIVNETTANKSSHKKLCIGLGFSTDRDVEIISRQAIDFYRFNNQYPSLPELKKLYFGIDIPSIDIFIRTNELKLSGGLSPLLAGSNMQLYFPVSPGILSFTIHNIKKILHDFLYNRNRSDGRFEHEVLEEDDALNILDYYRKQSGAIVGVGQRIGDIWIM